MFDVSWGDPASETVAQHRERKEREEHQSVRKAKRQSFRSTSSSSTSTRNPGTARSAFFSLFGGSKKTLAAENTKSTLKLEVPYTPSPPLPVPAPVIELEETTVTRILDQPAPYYKSRYRDSITETVLSSPTSRADSIFSGWLGRSNGTEASWSSANDELTKTHEIQSLSPDSFVTRSTEITISAPDPVAQVIRPMSQVRISANNIASGEATSDPESDLYAFPKVPTYTPSLTKSRSRPRITIRQGQIEVSEKKQKLWKPPDEWECLSDERHVSNQSPIQTPTRSSSRAQSMRSIRSTTSPRLTQMQRHIRRMEAANPKIILERLKEEWTEIADANIYKELEFEKQLWMLMGLRYLTNKAGGTRHDSYEMSSIGSSSPPVSKALSLYENQACTSFLATFSSATEIHHISTSSTTPAIPKIRPLIVPTAHAILPYAPSIFSSINALTLTSLLSAPSIPALLRECHRVLTPEGVLHLTVLDPAPVSSTMGPSLRAWLEENLLLNLETQFRCASPSRLLPIWLHDAGFRSQDERARVSKIRFWALGRGEGGFSGGEEEDGGIEPSVELGNLTAVVGRMLWREIWGNYVVGDRWWWEDENIVDECARMGTRWECSVLEIVKMV